MQTGAPDDNAPGPALVTKAEVLLVDDEPANLLALEAVLDSLGHVLVKAHSGEQAIALLHERDFAVVLLDVRMQGADGFETAQRMRSSERSRHTPIIFLTAHDGDGLDVERAYGLGAVDYLVKPVSPVVLRAKVTGFVELFQKTQHIKRQAEQLRRLEHRQFERKLQKENARLRDSEERFARFMQHLPGLAWVKDRAGRYVFANEAALKAFRTPRPEDLYGKSDDEVFDPGTAAQFKTNDQRALVSPGGVQVIETLDHGDGVKHYSLVSKFPIPGPDGTPALVGGMAIDITEYEHTRQVLEESEQRFKTLAAHAPVGIFQTDADGNCVYVNERWCALAGIPLAQARGQGWVSAIHPEDRERLREEWYEAARAGRPFVRECRFCTPDGKVTWVSGSAVALRNASGAVTGYLGTITDVDALKRAERAVKDSERLYRAIGESIDYGVWLCDAQGQNVYTSESFLDLVGLTQEECAKFGWGAALHPDDAERTIAAWKECVRTLGVWDIEHRFRGVDGTYHPVLARGVPVRDEQGIVVGWAGINLDISRLKEVERELRETNRRKDEFLAMLAHELRNPLAAIRNSAEVLRLLGHGDPNLQRASDVIERQVEHLARMVDDLLDVSRITRGKITLRKEPVELAPILARALETVRGLIDARRHDVAVTLPPTPVLVEGDPTRLMQAVGNLLNNAAKYTEEGGHIWLSLERDEGQAVIRVRDDGLGIPADLLSHVFDLFTQGDRTLARSEGGLGIGLTLVKSLVEMQGGVVEARSAGPGQGSEFSIGLPMLERRQNVRDESRRVTRRRGDTIARRILVVDDNVDAAETLAFVLRAEGHDVRTAYDGPAALEAAAAFQPEAILLDIGLPQVSGYDIARQLRQQPSTQEVLLIALTGYGQDEDQRLSREAGFDVHVVKPADPTALQALLAAGRTPLEAASREIASREGTSREVRREAEHRKEEQFP